MAGNIKNLKPWPKGVSGNPHGRVDRLPPEIRSERKKNQSALIRLVIAYFGLTDEQAMQRLSGPEATQLEMAVQGMISKAKEGDTPSFKYLTELICGKIPEVDIEANPVEEMSPEERLKAMKHAVEMLEHQVKVEE